MEAEILDPCLFSAKSGKGILSWGTERTVVSLETKDSWPWVTCLSAIHKLFFITRSSGIQIFCKWSYVMRYSCHMIVKVILVFPDKLKKKKLKLKRLFIEYFPILEAQSHVDPCSGDLFALENSLKSKA